MNRTSKLRFSLFLVMVASASVVGVMSLTISYHQALEEQKIRLAEIAQSRVRMIEAVAKFDSQYSVDYPGGSWEATLSQVREAHQNFKGFGMTGEFVLAKFVEDQIVFLLRLRHSELSPKNSTQSPIPLVSKFAEPMKKALQGHSGVMTGIDYRGEEVLAAFEPVALMDLGIVVKMDLAEIRTPFIRAGAISAVGGFIVIMVGGFIFLRISESFMSGLEYANKKLKEEYAKGQEQSQALESSKQKYQALFNQVKIIIEKVFCESGQQRYTALAQNLATSVGFKYCFIGELDPFDDRKIKTLAVWAGSVFLKNFSYEIFKTPCANVVGGTLCVYPDKVCERFPEDKILRDLGVEAYVGIPLNDSNDNPQGILCIMHDEPVADLAHAKLLLPLFADVAQSEMERQAYEKKLQLESGRAQVSRDIAIAANDFSNAESTFNFALKRFCQFIDWPVAHLYFKDEISSNLLPTSFWHIDAPSKYKTLKAVTENTILETGKGLPGRVVETQHSVWIRDVYADTNFPRARMSDQLGVRSALACPIFIRKEIVGVLEFFTPEMLAMDVEILNFAEQVGTQIGRVLERTRAENLLEKQAHALGQINDAVIALDNQFNITGWNKGAERIFGFFKEEMLGKPVARLFPADEDVLKQILIQPTIINNSYEKEMNAVTKSGELIYIHISLSALCDENCAIQSIVFYALDITEKKRARDQLESYSHNLEGKVLQRTAELSESVKKIKESKDQVEGILKSIEEGILVIDYFGKVLLINSAAENILEVERKNAVDKSVDQVFTNKLLLENLNVNAIAKYPSRHFDIELSGDRGSRKYIHGTSTLLKGSSNRALGIVVVVRDTTFEKKVDNLKSQFLSTAAHELRTPLTSLQGFSEILLKKTNLGKETERKYLGYINDESLKLATIINDFLDISRIESGKGISLNKAVCSVKDTIERSMHIFDEQINISHKFLFHYPDKIVNWVVDQDKVEQVLKNIYSNAIKYSPDGGPIVTTVMPHESSVEIVVEDEGLGMNEEQLIKIYDRFYRGESFSSDIPGTGLGMTIVKYILEAHGGRISVDSELGKGTKVHFNIPCYL